MSSAFYDTGIIELLRRRAAGEALSDAQNEQLHEWINSSVLKQEFVKEVGSDEVLAQKLINRYYFATDGEWEKMQARINDEDLAIRADPGIQRVHFLRTAWFRVAVAVLLVFGVGGYFLFLNKNNAPPLVENRINQPALDILPGGSKAILVLADESVITLDSAVNGVLARQGESEIIKTADGEILYVGTSKVINADAAIFYQKLITPRGGTYQITLPDGTQAWLNAESSIRFPNVFTANNRMVEITGEIYFDVKADKSKPFIVKSINGEITVMGTRFNVNSYANEIFKTTLIDGAVKVNQTVLRPGQAYVNGNILKTDVQQDIAWRNGYFNFTNLELNTVMQQIARWYNVHIFYEGRMPDIRFEGRMQRDLTLQQMLKALAAMGLRYTLQGQNLTVKP